MDFSDVTPWLGIGSGGWGIFLLVRDNVRLRGENKELRGADKRAAAAEAKVAGLEVKLADALERIEALERRVDGGVGHA